METFRKINNILGWVVFAAATLVYFLTLEPTASWWDCGEYIATAFKLQVGHPPGAPFFQLAGRFFSLFAFGDVSRVALMINAMSALSSSLTVMFLFWTITMLARKLFLRSGEWNTEKMVATLGSGLVGALAFTFSDSFWFSAAEGEVYGMSSFFTALVFWAILKWDRYADEKHSFRWLIFIAFLIGISIGVHLLNLLAIPAITFTYYFRRYKPTTKGIVYAGLISIALLALVMYIIIPWIVDLSAQFELFFVNSLGLPFNTGTIIYFLLLIGGIVYGLKYTASRGKVAANTAILSFLFLLIGYSSFFMLIIRSNANTPIDENNPEEAIGLLSYLNREQYGTNPLIYGEYYNAPLDRTDPYKDASPVYMKDEKSGKYVIVDDRKSSLPNYDKRFMTIFPRMWSSQKGIHQQEYKRWGGDGGIPIQVVQQNGETQTLIKPSFVQNLRYFFKYQVGHMYLRYFMWNFAGRQNDIQGHGSLHEGNWISGIGFYDRARLGNLDEYPETWASNQAHNKFYLLPLLLGIIGMIYHFKKNYKDALVVLLLFLMTGLAIVVYLNQYPYQPRERDYAYTGSFFAFAIWIGLGVYALYDSLKKLLPGTVSAILVTLASLVLVPGIMGREGWDDHNRANKYTARDFAINYLESCAPNAILITNGDNDTFPLWYAQEVEGVRTDVRVVNFMLASGGWYVQQMATKLYDSDPLPFTLRPEQYNRGTNDYVPYYNRDVAGSVELMDMIRFIASDQPSAKVSMQSGKKMSYFPSKKVHITIDSAAIAAGQAVPEKYKNRIVPVVEWEIQKNYLFKNDLMLLDFLATNAWKRPIYFASPSSMQSVLDVDRYCHLEGFVYRFMPVIAPEFIQGMGGISDTESNYDLLINKFNYGNLNDPRVSVDRESYRNSMIPKNNFMRIAQAFINEGNKDKARAIIDKCIEMFPDEKIAFDMYMLPFIDLYFQLGENEKAVDVSSKLKHNYTEELEYIDSLKPGHSKLFNNERQQCIGVLQRIQQMATQYGQKELQDEIGKILAAHPAPAGGS